MIDNNFNRKQYQENADIVLNGDERKDVGGGSLEERIALLQKYLKAKSRVFEIGSGAGRDALALQEAGFITTASDFVPEFVTHLQKLGLSAVEYDAKSDDLPEKFDAIYANAVFVHFSPEETTDFLKRVKPHLENDRIIFLTVLVGDGNERSARARGFTRDFQYYSLEEISEIVDEANFEILESRQINGKWIQIVAQAREE